MTDVFPCCKEENKKIFFEDTGVFTLEHRSSHYLEMKSPFAFLDT